MYIKFKDATSLSTLFAHVYQTAYGHILEDCSLQCQ